MRWPWSRRRETRGYTSTIVNALEAAAAGTGDGVATGCAAIEAASGLWARSLAVADVQPRSGRTASLTPDALALIARSLCRHGEIVFLIEVSGSRVSLSPASTTDIVAGSVDPATWTYSLTTTGPGTSTTRLVGRAGVAHVMYARDAIRPWVGRAPWSSAGMSSDLMVGIERQLANESKAPSGYTMPVPDRGDLGDEDGEDDQDPLATMRADMANAKGGILLAPTSMAGWGSGPGAAPVKDFRAERFGMNPPQSVLEARRDVERSIYAASGIPPVMMDPKAPGTAMREAHRQLVVSTIEPLTRLIGAQLSEALGVEITITVPRHADTATLARAVHSLTQAGMTVDDARETVGL